MIVKDVDIMKSFENYVDMNLLPLIREQLLDAYYKGYKRSRMDAYIKSHHIEGHIVDFGLPSGTIWVVRMEGLTFRDAKGLGLQFPTEEQIHELQKCKWTFVQGDAWHCHIIGPNGHEEGVFDSCHAKLCVWTDKSCEDDNFMVPCYVYSRESDDRLTKSSVYAGDRFSTLLVLPQELS